MDKTYSEKVFILSKVYFTWKQADFQATYDADCLAAHNSTEDSQGTRIHIF